jgi:hypothetical protein
MMLYQQLINVPRAHESSQDYSLISERHIQIIWSEQKYFSYLYTSEGERITILSPGIWNTEAGPDFLKAHLYIGTKEYRGDVEIHLVDESWNEHGHHQDERYNQTILHVSLWKTKPYLSNILKKNGKEVPRVYLEDSLTVSVDRLIQVIDLDFYPYQKFSESGRCAEKLFSSLSEEQIFAFLTSASQWRLEQKQNYLQARFVSSSLQLMAGIGMALGYKQNAEAFLELLNDLLFLRDDPSDVVLAIALGCCGFFDHHAKQQWESSVYYQNLKKIWWGKKDRITHQSNLKLAQIRPLNHPVRRLAYLVKLIQDPHSERIWDEVILAWKRFLYREKRTKKEMMALRKELLSLIPCYQDPYWNYHYTFENQTQKRFLPLIGQDLKIEILINTFFPLLYVDIKNRGDFSEWGELNSFYGTFQAACTNKSRYLTSRFFGKSLKGEILKKAQMEQGAYQLHKDFCIHFEASCEGCPFVERYRARFNSTHEGRF